MDAEVAKKPQKIKRKSLPKIFIIAGIIIVLGALAAVLIFKGNIFSKNATVTQRTATVTKGNLSVTITGSGSVESSNREDITPTVTGKLTKVYFNEGDKVKKGDLLFEIDDSEAKLNVENVNNNIAQAKLSAVSDTKSLNNLAIKAPFKGRITGISVKTGDELGKSAVVMTITNTSEMKVTIPFSSAAAGKITLGQKATLNIQDVMQSVVGEVTYISGNSYVSDNGGEVIDVEISINNPGSLKDSMAVSAEIGSYTGTGTGMLSFADSQIIKSITSGIVKSINVKENQIVSSGTTLLVLQNDELEISSQTSMLKLENLNVQLKSAEEQLASYKIYSQIDGVIVSQDAIVGDSVSMNNSLATISDVGNMQFTMDIDELDIDKIKAGQTVSITIDALTATETKPLTGVVSKVAVEGTSSNGVTTYPVTIKFDDPSSLKVGMNANAEIVTSEKTDVLLVPLEAVQTAGNRSFVWVKSDGTTGNQNSGFNPGNGTAASGSAANGPDGNAPSGNASDSTSSTASSGGTRGNKANMSSSASSSDTTTKRSSAVNTYYAGAVMKSVEIGLSNDSYVEITSGLSEGDIVILPQLTASTSSSTATATQSGGMGSLGGGFGGGMDMGGGVPPSGNTGSKSTSSKN